MQSIETNNLYKEEKRRERETAKKDRILSLLKAPKPIPKKQQGEKVPKEKKKKPSRWKLVKKLDAIFSRYIRLRYTAKWLCMCVTCKESKRPEEMQNWHYITRGNYKYRRHEANCHPQCYKCNCILNWNYKQYTLYMIDRYGRVGVQSMIEDKELIKIKTYEIEEMIQKYTQLVKELEKVNI